jgi:GDP-L-fucose synthase
MAAACVFVMNLAPEVYQAQVQPQNSHINVGYGSDVTIAELAQLVARVVGYQGAVVFDTSMPDGTPRKLMDSSRLNALGWRPTTSLEDGLKVSYKDFLARGT